MSYRPSRNIEASIQQYLEAQLASAWSGVSVTQVFSRVYELNLPIICIRSGITVHDSIEVGSDSTVRNPQILLDIFASDDGQRLDLKDFLISILKGGCVYNEYVIANGAIQSTTPTGRIRILTIDDAPINNDVDDKSKLDIHDRYRHLLTLSVSLGKVEI